MDDLFGLGRHDRWTGDTPMFFLVHHQLPPCPRVVLATISELWFTVYFWHMSMFQWSIDVPSGVLVLVKFCHLRLQHVSRSYWPNLLRRFIFRRTCHMSISGWSVSLHWPNPGAYKYVYSLSYPLTFLTFSSLPSRPRVSSSRPRP